MKIIKPLAVIYDVDGTVVDTEEIHENGWTYACREVTGITPTKQNLFDQKGLPGDAAVRLFLSEEMYNKEVSDKIRKIKKEFIRDHLASAPVHEGFVDTHDTLTEKYNLPVWACTSASEADIETIAGANPELSFLKDKTLWKGAYHPGKPSAVPLIATLERMGISLTERGSVPYVGDALADSSSAGNAGMPFVYFCSDQTQRDQRIPESVPIISDHRDLIKYLEL